MDYSTITEEGPSLDELFSALADRRRRFTIHYLQERERPVAMADLAKAIVEWEAEELDSEAPEPGQIYVDLYHAQLPLLTDIDVVQFDGDRNTVQPGESFSAVASFLEDISTEPSPAVA